MLILRLFVSGHIVAMVTCYVKKVFATYLLMIGHLYITIIAASYVK